MKGKQIIRVVVALLLLLVGLQAPVLAHVKWFSTYSFLHPPLLLAEVLSTGFWGLAVLSLVVISVLVFIDASLMQQSWYQQCCQSVSRFASKSDLIIRVAVGAVLLLSWQSGALLVPELTVNNPWIDFIQLFLAVLILSNRFTVYAGMGLVVLYLGAFLVYSSVHMLDYMYLLGAGYYLMVANHPNKKLQESSLLALYASVGFSLCWVAQEKLFYPGWGLEILENNPQLALGLDFEFFLQSSAFVEFSLGFLLIVCMLQRPIALIITLVFMSTTLVFGKMEFVGHAIVHAALIVFFLKGPGTTFRTPITFFKHRYQRLVFANVSFALLLGAMVWTYSGSSMWQYEMAQAQREEDPHNMVFELAAFTDDCPEIDIEITEDPHGGWNLHLLTQNFEFAPEAGDQKMAEGYGHAHLYINNEKAARIYGPWYHIKELPAGKHEIRVALTSNNHSEYVMNGRPLAAVKTLVVN